MILLDEEDGDLSTNSDNKPIQPSLVTNDALASEPEVSLHALTNASNL